MVRTRISSTGPRAAQEASRTPVAGAGMRRFVGMEILLSIVSGVVSLVLGMFALRIGPRELAERWGTGGSDQVLHYGIFSAARDAFPFLPNTHLGFPLAQNLFFAPLFDIWSALFVWVIGPVVPNGIWALNVYNVSSFFAVGVTSYLFFRALRVRRPVAVVFGVIFAIVPYHFLQLAMGHPFLSNYWALPLAGIVVLMAAGERTNPFAAWIARAPDRRHRLTRRLVPIVVLGAAVAWTQSYYFVFAALIVGSVWGVCAITALVQGRGWRSLVWPTVTTGILFVFIALQLAFLAQDFGDRYAKYFGARTFADSELYGGKWMDLILPSSQSGIGLFAQLGKSYRESSPLLPSSESAATAIVAIAAIVLTMLVLLVRIVWRPSGPTGNAAPGGRLASFLLDERVGVLVVAFVTALMFFMVSGLGTTLAFFVSGEIRSWSRMSIVVSMLALGVLAIFVDSLARRRWILAVVLVAVGAVALVDQTRLINFTLPLQAVSDSSLESFTASAERLLPDGCGVAMLPLKGFPETGPIGAMGDYDEMLPYVYATSDDLRWSYGAVQGTKDADFWASVTTPAQFGTAVAESGACAVMVDTYAYQGNPDGWKEWVSAAGADPSSPTITSTDPQQRYLLFQRSAP
ncbi:hypothetical protein KPL76_06640 [Subtercola sp. PAMC28395]|uniref:hypothetical protein n=1 Tax=Subtercola sp. PAMC28395 TaxID=2846775 RepID=UPI001C0B4D16|nr:hypothetical protein [Subtercola sp. PAMC28395]QWT25019.1 hypothetical protein KPL76_06640 [Subtercola sp. PAMC28395]